MEAQNLIIVMSDEHAGKYTGYAGHPVVRTPNMDRLAARGTAFLQAYCNSPICMPSRASFATGKYPHETGYFCNATPYDGAVPGWPHVLGLHGVPVQSIGKLHYRDKEVSSGFDESHHAMYALHGIGDVFGAIRQEAPLPVRYGVRQVAEKVGAGESDYTRYDRTIANRALAWLRETAPRLERPWVLFVSFVAPHFPLIAPEEFYALYDPGDLDLPKACRPEDWPSHPWFSAFRQSYITDQFFDDDLRRRATAAYFGLCSFVDHHLGQIMDAVESGPLTDNTRLIYTSDHGDNLGVRGLWQKSNFYQESAQVPLILAGEGVPEQRRSNVPVSLVDLYPTILQSAGIDGLAESVNEDAASLFDIANGRGDKDRIVFGEYHAAGAVNGVFMLRQGPWKYVHYANMVPQLFNLADDPEELTDLAGTEAGADICRDFERELRRRIDPEKVDADIKAAQLEIVNRHGGAAAVLSKGSMGASPPPGTTVSDPRTA